MNDTHLENHVNNNVEGTNSNTDIKNENINVINISDVAISTSEKNSTVLDTAVEGIGGAEVKTANAETCTVSHETACSSSYGTTSCHSSTKVEKPSVDELPKIVQKLEKLEKMINPNSKKSLILWEEDNSFKNLISSLINLHDSSMVFAT